MVLYKLFQRLQKTSAFVTGEIGENKTYKSIVGADLAENGFYTQVRGQRLESDGSRITDLKGNDIKKPLMIKRLQH